MLIINDLPNLAEVVGSRRSYYEWEFCLQKGLKKRVDVRHDD